jgi:hypothetical protein
MRKTLFATTAAVALVAGMSLTAAQTPGPRGDAPKASEAPKAAETPKAGEAPKKSGEVPKKSDRTGQAPKAGESPKAAETPKAGEAPKAAETPKAGEAPKAAENPKAGERGNEVRSVILSSEQKTRVHEVIIKDRSARVDRVDFQIRIGVRVPRTVHVFDVPEEIVTVVPQYRGFKYIIVGDELLIIDRDTLEIVAVVRV